MKEKIFMALVCISLLSGFVYATSVYEKTCPYDDDFKHALRKALIDYLKDPSTSKLTLDEIKEMLSFYLSKASIMDADCSQKNMNSLADKAENQIPDSILDIFKPRKIDKKCVDCSDGTVCREKNVKGQTCRCRDIDKDGEYEFCHLNPLRPKPTQPTCDSCPDGTVCKEKNQQGQTCKCKDINDDGDYEYCYLRPLIPPKPPYPACDSCPDGTVCGEKNAKSQTCRCKDIDNDGEYEYCYLKPSMPPYPTCESCPDGTVCGEMNQQGQTCECKDINGDGTYEYCYLRPLPIVCHKHTNPAWLTTNDYDIMVVDKGCTSAPGAAYGEYLIDLREASHPYCGERLWVWLDPGAGSLEVGKCYRVVINVGVNCGHMITGVGNEISCPVCPTTTTTTLPAGCHTHENPSWLMDGTHKIKIMELGCTHKGCAEGEGDAKEALIEIREGSHCGEQFWVWVDMTMTPNMPDIGACYNAEIFTTMYGANCGHVIRYLFQVITCPDCEGTQTCTDTDGGRDYYKKGEVYWSAQNYIIIDVCKGDIIHEYYCEGDIYKETDYHCPNGCQDGACVKDKEPY